MKKRFAVSMLAILGSASLSPAHAADIRFNGFASVVGGMTVKEGKVKAPQPGFPEGDATFLADAPTGGTYDSNFSFSPDTIYGLQVMADLGDGLSATAQFTGAGGEDFDVQIQWAYLSYNIIPEGTVSAGRMRFPYFFYSDYLDVAYAYHWIRPPVEVYAIPASDYEGVQYQQQFTLGSWDGRVQVYYGNAEAEIKGKALNSDDLVGLVGYISNDWLQFRATHVITDVSVEGSELIPGVPQDRDNPVGTSFSGIAARAQLGDGFIMAEYTLQELDDPISANSGQATEKSAAWYVTAGYSFGSITPHLTYAEKKSDRTTDANLFGGPALYSKEQTHSNSSVTAGVRWNFHPSAAFKVEYTSSTDESSKEYAAIWGDESEVDVFTVGVDVIF